MFAQCIAKHFPVLSAESEGAEKAGLTCAVAVIRIEQIIDDLLSFDQQPLSTRKNHVRCSTDPRPSNALPSGRARARRRHTSQRIRGSVVKGQGVSGHGTKISPSPVPASAS